MILFVDTMGLLFPHKGKVFGLSTEQRWELQEPRLTSFCYLFTRALLVPRFSYEIFLIEQRKLFYVT